MNLKCPVCLRTLDVIFSEEYEAFLSDRKFPVGLTLLDEKGGRWTVKSVEKAREEWMGWRHNMDRYVL